jgi:outer membrane protein assembly factor BamB
MGADAMNDTVYALDTRTGKRVWTTAIGPRKSLDRGDGPRGTPTVDGDKLYAIGPQGDLVCLEIGKGKKLWSVGLVKDLGGSRPNWGFSESPLIDGDKLICTPGGKNGTLAALDKKTGKTLWRSEVTYPAHYSSAIIAEVGGIRHYIQLTRNGVFGVSPKDGKTLWTDPLGGCGTAAIPTPIYHDGYVFVTSGYGDSKDGLIKLTAVNGKITPTEVYSGRSLVNKHGGVVLLDGVLYGSSEAGGPWVALDFMTGKKLGWDARNLSKGSLTYADGRLYLYSEDDGTVVLLEPDAKTWKQTGRFQIPEKTKERPRGSNIWTHPVVANGRLYLRDHELIFCYDVRATN